MTFKCQFVEKKYFLQSSKLSLNVLKYITYTYKYIHISKIIKRLQPELKNENEKKNK